eukprot:403360558
MISSFMRDGLKLVEMRKDLLQNYGYAKDKKRAQQILNVELDNKSDTDDEKQNISANPIKQQQYQSKQFQKQFEEYQNQNISTKRSEVSFYDQVMSMRSDHYLALEEKKMGFTKKRAYNKSDVRCLQSKINLKFPIRDMLQDKPKEKLQIKEGVIEEFEKKYSEMCNQQYQIKKNRDVSPTSPFDKMNVPPKQYLEADYKLSTNPNKHIPSNIDVSKVPLAGHLSELGEKILALGSKKAQYISTFNMSFMSPQNHKNEYTAFNQTYGKFNFKDIQDTQRSSDVHLPKIPSFRQLSDSKDLNKAYDQLFNGNLDVQLLKRMMQTNIKSPFQRSRQSMGPEIIQQQNQKYQQQSTVQGSIDDLSQSNFKINQRVLNELKDKRLQKRNQRLSERSSVNQLTALSQTQNSFYNSNNKFSNANLNILEQDSQSPNPKQERGQFYFPESTKNSKYKQTYTTNHSHLASRVQLYDEEKLKSQELEISKKLRLEGILKNIAKKNPRSSQRLASLTKE